MGTEAGNKEFYHRGTTGTMEVTNIPVPQQLQPPGGEASQFQIGYTTTVSNGMAQHSGSMVTQGTYSQADKSEVTNSGTCALPLRPCDGDHPYSRRGQIAQHSGTMAIPRYGTAALPPTGSEAALPPAVSIAL